jgi:hypothetical protein
MIKQDILRDVDGCGEDFPCSECKNTDCPAHPNFEIKK